MAQEYAFLVDAGKCIMCRGCVVACKVENHVGSQWQRNDVVMIGPDQRRNPAAFAVFMNCQQCEFPPCIAACPVEGKALEKRDDGIVIVKTDKCDGDEMCVYACPYGAMRLSSHKNELGFNVVDKCTFCVHKRDRDPSETDTGGNRPACVSTCPTNAIDFGLRDELLTRVEASGREIWDIDLFGTGPSNIYLKPLPVRKEELLG
jgi:Fe-S-cluster-containing dehydrogenase component